MKIKQLLFRFKKRFLFTLFLILAEVSLGILFPLFIGIAIDGAIQGSYTGALQLGGLGVLALIIGISRRVYDSRLYAKIFVEAGTQTISTIQKKTTSIKTARLNMLEEVVEFMENSLPALIQNIVGLVGIIVIIAFLNIKIFWGGIITLILIFIIYLITEKRTLYFHQSYNNELEKQVDIITTNDPQKLSQHLHRTMHWNMKLSDLEAGNFSLSWLILMVLLVASIIIAIQDGIVQYGALFALIVYVFDLIESIMTLPLFYQHWIRLSEIIRRLDNVSQGTNS